MILQTYGTASTTNVACPGTAGQEYATVLNTKCISFACQPTAPVEAQAGSGFSCEPFASLVCTGDTEFSCDGASGSSCGGNVDCAGTGEFEIDHRWTTQTPPSTTAALPGGAGLVSSAYSLAPSPDGGLIATLPVDPPTIAPSLRFELSYAILLPPSGGDPQLLIPSPWDPPTHVLRGADGTFFLTDAAFEKAFFAGSASVRLPFPWEREAGAAATDWVRVAQLGSQRGSVWLPEVNDEVVVDFELDSGAPVVRLKPWGPSESLLKACAPGANLKDVKIKSLKAGDEKQEYLRFHLSDAVVTSVRLSDAGAAEEIALSFEKIQVNYLPSEAENGKAGFDLRPQVFVTSVRAGQAPTEGVALSFEKVMGEHLPVATDSRAGNRTSTEIRPRSGAWNRRVQLPHTGSAPVQNPPTVSAGQPVTFGFDGVDPTPTVHVYVLIARTGSLYWEGDLPAHWVHGHGTVTLDMRLPEDEDLRVGIGHPGTPSGGGPGPTGPSHVFHVTSPAAGSGPAAGPAVQNPPTVRAGQPVTFGFDGPDPTPTVHVYVLIARTGSLYWEGDLPAHWVHGHGTVTLDMPLPEDEDLRVGIGHLGPPTGGLAGPTGPSHVFHVTSPATGSGPATGPAPVQNPPTVRAGQPVIFGFDGVDPTPTVHVYVLIARTGSLYWEGDLPAHWVHGHGTATLDMPLPEDEDLRVGIGHLGPPTGGLAGPTGPSHVFHVTSPATGSGPATGPAPVQNPPTVRAGQPVTFGFDGVDPTPTVHVYVLIARTGSLYWEGDLPAHWVHGHGTVTLDMPRPEDEDLRVGIGHLGPATGGLAGPTGPSHVFHVTSPATGSGPATGPAPVQNPPTVTAGQPVTFGFDGVEPAPTVHVYVLIARTGSLYWEGDLPAHWVHGHGTVTLDMPLPEDEDLRVGIGQPGTLGGGGQGPTGPSHVFHVTSAAATGSGPAPGSAPVENPPRVPFGQPVTIGFDGPDPTPTVHVIVSIARTGSLYWEGDLPAHWVHGHGTVTLDMPLPEDEDLRVGIGQPGTLGGGGQGPTGPSHVFHVNSSTGVQQPGRMAYWLVKNLIQQQRRRFGQLAPDIGTNRAEVEEVALQQGIWCWLEAWRDWLEGLLRLEPGALALGPAHTQAKMAEQFHAAWEAAGVRSQRARDHLVRESVGLVNPIVEAGTGKFQRLTLA